MDLPELVPGLHLIPLGISNAYLWQDDEGATLVDTGPPGSVPAIRGALDHLGVRREKLRRIVLTHFHYDHAGASADLAAWLRRPPQFLSPTQARSDRTVPNEVWEKAARQYDEKGLAAIIHLIAATTIYNRPNVSTRQVAGAWD